MINNPVIPTFQLGTLIGNFVGVAIIIAGLLTLLYLVLGGIEWISSAGDKAGLESARNRITNALIGLAIVVASWALMTLITTFLQFPFPCIPIPSLDGKLGTCPVATDSGGTKPTGGEETPGGPPVPFKCTTDQDCVKAKKGRICENGDKCISTCRAWDNNPISCYAHGVSCGWVGANPNAPPGNCFDK